MGVPESAAGSDRASRRSLVAGAARLAVRRVADRPRAVVYCRLFGPASFPERSVRSTRRSCRLLASLLLAAACAPDDRPSADPAATLPPGAEALSFLGDTLYAPELPEAVSEVYAARYAEAEAALARAPQDVDSLIWMGRRTAYLGRYREAIEIFTRALEMHPADARLYRHRGHRWVTVREPDRAIADFRRGLELRGGLPDEVEPDGLPNALGVPTSTLHFNLWYHLGLAHYLKGEWSEAADAYASCLEASEHPDSKVATSYWLYLTLRRLGRDAEAAALLEAIHADLEIIESTAYLDLLLLFKGERTAEDLLGPSGEDATLQSTTAAYGVGAWHLLGGREAEARRIFERVVAGRDQWAAFGYIAAESELARARVEGGAP